jgi:hypothetical protein
VAGVCSHNPSLAFSVPSGTFSILSRYFHEHALIGDARQSNLVKPKHFAAFLACFYQIKGQKSYHRDRKSSLGGVGEQLFGKLD